VRPAGLLLLAGVALDPCLARLAPLPAAALLGEAVRVLRATGHDPAAFRAELHLETGAREPSVVFRPLEPGDGYAVRVDPAIPCGLLWVWEPERFTPWQRDAIRRATEAARSAGPLPAGDLSDVRVVEWGGRLAVELWTAESSELPALTVFLRASDLALEHVGLAPAAGAVEDERTGGSP
jgi:hypothetical protein